MLFVEEVCKVCMLLCMGSSDLHVLATAIARINASAGLLYLGVPRGNGAVQRPDLSILPVTVSRLQGLLIAIMTVSRLQGLLRAIITGTGREYIAL